MFAQIQPTINGDSPDGPVAEEEDEEAALKAHLGRLKVCLEYNASSGVASLARRTELTKLIINEIDRQADNKYIYLNKICLCGKIFENTFTGDIELALETYGY